MDKTLRILIITIVILVGLGISFIPGVRTPRWKAVASGHKDTEQGTINYVIYEDRLHPNKHVICGEMDPERIVVCMDENGNQVPQPNL